MHPLRPEPPAIPRLDPADLSSAWIEGEHAHRYARQAAFLADLTLDLAREEETGPMFERVVRELGGLVGADVVAVGLHDEEAGLRPVTVSGDAPPVLHAWLGKHVTRAHGGVLWSALDSGRPLFVDAYADAPGAVPDLVDDGLTAVAHVPILASQARRGLLSAFRLGGGPWDAGTRAVLQATAGALQVNLIRVERIRELADTAAFAQALAAVAMLNDDGASPADVARAAIAAVAGPADLDGASLADVDDEGLHVLADWGDASPYVSLRHLPRGMGACWDALDRREGVWIDDYPAHPKAVPAYVDAGVSSVAFLPLAGGRMLLTASRMGRLRPWRARDRDLFAAVGRAVQVAVDRAAQAQLLREAALTDALTELRNRRALDADLATDLADARRSKQPLSLLVLDVDSLKVVNDTFGHARGDELLRAVAEALVRSFRQADRVYRHGGDEFAVLLRHTGADAWRAIRERVAEAARSVRSEFPAADLSAGMASYPDEAADADALLTIADQRMYDSKWSRKTPMAR
ncbi:MAG: diguanylate cyclase domain-containing protein [Myxococcota bacterium]